MKKLLLLFIVLYAAPVLAQQQQTLPDCQMGPAVSTATGRVMIFDNRALGCTNWTLYEFTNGVVTGLNIELDEAPDAGSTPGAWTIWPAAARGAATTTYPITNTANGQATLFTFYPWVSVNITTLTGTGGNVTYEVLGFRPRFGADASGNGVVSAGNAGALNVQSTQATTTNATQEGDAAAGLGTCFPSSSGACAPLSVQTFGIDPCNANGVAKLHAFANITTATTTALVAVSGSTAVYVCEVDFELASTTTADTVLFEQGTGAACAGTPTSLTATYTNAATAIATFSKSLGSGASTNFKVAASNGLCAVSTVGTTPTISVDVEYVQQ
jgi:hypothetical protein